MDSSELLNNMLHRYSKDMMLVVEPATLMIIDASNEILKRLLYSRNELIGKKITDIDHNLSSVIFWNELQRGNETQLVNAESDFLMGNGQQFPVMKNVKHINFLDMNWLIVEAIDNSKLKRDEDALVKLSSQLKSTLEAAGDGILVISNHGTLSNMNHRFSSMWNIPNHVLDEGINEINRWVSQALSEPNVYRHLLEHLDENIENDAPLKLELKNGQIFEARIYPQKSANELEGYVLNFHDITEHVQYEQALILEWENAERSSRYKGDFLSNMSHELRTPLNAILGFSQIMGLDAELSTDNKQYVQEIINAGNHLLDLINEVLDLTKIESGHFEMALEDFEVGQLIHECLVLVATLANDVNIQLHFQNVDDIRIRADRKRLKQVLLNLLSNAVKYNSEQGQVYVSAAIDDNDRLQISIKDTGPGIPRDMIKDLFQPFNRLGAEKRHIEGTGIGLTLSQRIMGIMDGDIVVDSEEGKGSTFTLHMPVGSQAPSTDNRSSNEDAKSSVEKTSNQTVKIMLNVLVVEDVLANQVVARKLIERLGHKVHISENGFEAIESVKNRHYDMVFMDMKMPEMDGITATRKIRKLGDDMSQLPIIAMTANATKEDREDCIKAGMNDFIAKPIDIEALEQILQTVIDQKIQHNGLARKASGSDE